MKLPEKKIIVSFRHNKLLTNLTNMYIVSCIHIDDLNVAVVCRVTVSSNWAWVVEEMLAFLVVGCVLRTLYETMQTRLLR